MCSRFCIKPSFGLFRYFCPCFPFFSLLWRSWLHIYLVCHLCSSLDLLSGNKMFPHVVFFQPQCREMSFSLTPETHIYLFIFLVSFIWTLPDAFPPACGSVASPKCTSSRFQRETQMVVVSPLSTKKGEHLFKCPAQWSLRAVRKICPVTGTEWRFVWPSTEIEGGSRCLFFYRLEFTESNMKKTFLLLYKVWN